MSMEGATPYDIGGNSVEPTEVVVGPELADVEQTDAAAEPSSETDGVPEAPYDQAAHEAKARADARAAFADLTERAWGMAERSRRAQDGI